MAGFVSARQGEVLAEGMGVRAATLLSSRESDGRLFVFHYEAPPGFAGPALHRHADVDETLYVLEGRITVQADDERHEVEAGQVVFLPRGTVHGFANATDAPAAFVGVVNPAGQIEEMLAEIGRYLAESRGQADPKRIAEINTRYGAEVLGSPILLSDGAHNHDRSISEDDR